MSEPGDVGACADRDSGYLPPQRRNRIGAQGSGQFPMTQTQHDRLAARRSGDGDWWREGASATASRRRRFRGVVLGAIVLVIVIILLAGRHAHARDSGQWGEMPANIRQWFNSLMQPDNPVQSCCGEADAFEADEYTQAGDNYLAVVTDGRGMMPNGTRILVPNRKIKWDKGNPTGHGILFMSGEVQPSPDTGYAYVQVGNGWRILYCYVAPGGV